MSEQAFFTSKPTGPTRFLRTFLPWQFVRFLMINVKMTRMILRSHGKH